MDRFLPVSACKLKGLVCMARFWPQLQLFLATASALIDKTVASSHHTATPGITNTQPPDLSPKAPQRFWFWRPSPGGQPHRGLTSNQLEISLTHRSPTAWIAARPRELTEDLRSSFRVDSVFGFLLCPRFGTAWLSPRRPEREELLDAPCAVWLLLVSLECFRGAERTAHRYASVRKRVGHFVVAHVR